MAEQAAPSLSQEIRIGNVTFPNRVFLAPMSGVSDLPFRELAWQFGAGMVVSEMVASEALANGNPEMCLRSAAGSLPVHVMQIAGREARWMARATQIACDSGADLIDINMGCPAKRVTNGYSGSALMRDLDHAMELIEAVVSVAEVPVTLKMRLGWDHNQMNAPELAQRAEAAGIAMITVHGRTRCQFYKRHADWHAVAGTVNAVCVPVVVNGDIASRSSAMRALAASGAEAVMVGRNAIGSPWLAAQIAGKLSDAEVAALKGAPDVPIAHLQASCRHYGEQMGVRQFRKHLAGYFGHLELDEAASSSRVRALTAGEAGFVEQLIRETYAAATPREAETPGLAAA